MIEDSIDNFILNYKTYAAEIEILPKLEGGSLVDAVVANIVIQFFERTGPYESKVGMARAILNPTVRSFHPNPTNSKAIVVTGISELEAKGLVLEREANTIILDAGVPLVISCYFEIPDAIIAGEWIGIESLSPIHGFVLAKPKSRKEF